MTTEEIYQTITPIFRSELDNDSIELRPNMTAMDVETWDSITNIQLIVAIEKKLGIRFTSKEIQGFKNVGELVASIEAKKSA